MNTSDTVPWYKQFWPWFLIVLPGSAVIASLYTVSLAMRSTDSLVTIADDGMDVVAERHAAAERRAMTLGLAATLQIDSATGAILAVLASSSMEAKPQSLQLLLSHPTNALRDQTVMLSAALPDSDRNPRFSGHLLSTPSGKWYLVLTPSGEAADEWRLTGVWKGESSLRLLPAGGDAGD